MEKHICAIITLKNDKGETHAFKSELHVNYEYINVEEANQFLVDIFTTKWLIKLDKSVSDGTTCIAESSKSEISIQLPDENDEFKTYYPDLSDITGTLDAFSRII